MTIYKICSICKENKPIDDFYKQNKVNSNGEKYIYYNPECKECTKQKSTTWANNNIEQSRKTKLKWAKSNYDVCRASYLRAVEEGKMKIWRGNNKDKLREYNKKHRKHHVSKNEWEICKRYFDYECAYCGLHIDNPYITYAGGLKKTDFHKEHVQHDGSNGIENCVPSCKYCNGKKHQFTLDEWYNKENEVYSTERYEKIMKWLDLDYMVALNTNK